MFAFQSTHPHGVRLLYSPILFVPPCFNPRTHTGCDFAAFRLPPNGKSFNPRTHTGCDGAFCHFLMFSPYVSIHAPTRGATHIYKMSIETLKFQSTHPHGVRLNQPLHKWGFCSFNPRTHTGCDFAQWHKVHFCMLFQSTHPHGVRRVVFLCLVHIAQVSIHAPTRGATQTI